MLFEMSYVGGMHTHTTYTYIYEIHVLYVYHIYIYILIDIYFLRERISLKLSIDTFIMHNI